MTKIYTTESNTILSDQNGSTPGKDTYWLPFDKPTPLVSLDSTSSIRDIEQEKENQTLKSTTASLSRD